MRELEKSLLDLHQIFLDMAVLVEAQGEMLDNIEAQVRALLIDPCHGQSSQVRMGRQDCHAGGDTGSCPGDSPSILTPHRRAELPHNLK